MPQTPHSAHTKPRLPSALFCGKTHRWKRCFSAGLSEGGERLGKTQLFLFSDPPRRWFYFDYDPGPFSCVHLQVFIFIFIIAPQKTGSTLNHGFTGILFYKNTDLIFLSRETTGRKTFLPRTPTHCSGIGRQNKTPSSVLRRTKKGVLFGYCLGVRRNHVTWESGCGPASHGKSITAFTFDFVKKL